MAQILMLDGEWCEEIIGKRKRRDIDRYDEVWDGVYVIFPPTTTRQQEIVGDLGMAFREIIGDKVNGHVYSGANVSDRKKGWEQNHRIPDVVVVLKNSRAVNCNTHFFRGPDFLVEIDSPGHAAHEKVAFYEMIGVRELLILDWDSTRMWLYRHNGQAMSLVEPTPMEGRGWLASAVLPVAFRRKKSDGVARICLRRTDGQPGQWTI